MKPAALAVLAALTVAGWGGPAAAGNGKSALRLLPSDSAAVIALDVDRLEKSPHFPKMIALARSRPDLAAPLETLRAAGLDPERDISTLVIGAPVGAETDIVMIFEGSFAARSVAAAIAKGKGSYTANTHRGVSFWSSASSSHGAIGKRLVFATSAVRFKAVIDASRAKDKSAVSSAPLAQLIADTETGKGIWFAGRIDESGDKTRSMPELTGVCGSADVQTTGVAVEMALTATTEDAAASIKSQLDMAIGLGSGSAEFGPLLKKVTLSQNANRIEVAVKLSKADVEALTSLLPAVENPAEAPQ